MAGLVPAERLDSASVAAAAVRAALRGAPFSITSRYPPIYKHVAHLLHLLPLRMRNAAVAWGASWSVGTTFESLREMDGDLLARHLLKGWPKRRFSGIHMGSPAGGAASWAAVEWSPFLPTSVLFSLQCRKDPDDLDAVISRAKAWGKELAPRLPDWELVWHHDPIHDRLLVRNVLHLRCRLKRLPASWSDWIRSHIPPSSPALLHHLPGYMWPRWGLGEAGFF
ncbi:hypothetical protein H8D30_06165 [bacterium]|nr:hypothetical protein [bacterium]